MTFEEFFKKKRIDLIALEQGERSLFSEFQNHFGQMGEKSFDHTKKYWFNKLRRQFPLAPEVKTEKAHIANPLAEQTITESLIETVAAAPSPKMGFVPKFKAGSMPKPVVAEDTKEETPPPIVAIDAESSATPKTEPVAPKLGFVPKFKAGVTPKPVVAVEDKKDEPLHMPVAEPNVETAAPSPKLGFKPKFKAANMPKPIADTESKTEMASTPVVEETPIEDSTPTDATPGPSAENVEAKPAYKPKFKMRNMPPKAGE